MFEDILGQEEEFHDDVIEFEWYGDSESEDGPKVLDLGNITDEELSKEIERAIDEAMKYLFDDESEDPGDDKPAETFGI